MADDSGKAGADRATATLTADQAAALFGKSRQWVFNLIKAGFIAKEARGRYTLVALIRGVMAYYDDMLNKQTQSKAASRATEARAAEIEQRIAMRDRALIPIDDATAAIDQVAGIVNSELSGLPARISRDLAIRKKAEAEVHASKKRISATLEKVAGAARTGVGLDEPGAGDDA